MMMTEHPKPAENQLSWESSDEDEKSSNTTQTPEPGGTDQSAETICEHLSGEVAPQEKIVQDLSSETGGSARFEASPGCEKAHSEALEAIRLTKEAMLRERIRTEPYHNPDHRDQEETSRGENTGSATEEPGCEKDVEGTPNELPSDRAGLNSDKVDDVALDALLNMLDNHGLGKYAESLATLGVGSLESAAALTDEVLCSPGVGMDLEHVGRLRTALDQALSSAADEKSAESVVEGSPACVDESGHDRENRESSGSGEHASRTSAEDAPAALPLPATKRSGDAGSTVASQALSATAPPQGREEEAGLEAATARPQELEEEEETGFYDDYLLASAAAVAAEHRMQCEDDAAAKAKAAKGAALAAGALGGVVLGGGTPVALAAAAAAYSVAGGCGEGYAGGGNHLAGETARALGSKTLDAVGTAGETAKSVTSSATAAAAAALAASSARLAAAAADSHSREGVGVERGAAGGAVEGADVRSLPTAEQLRLAESALADQLRLNSELVARAERLSNLGPSSPGSGANPPPPSSSAAVAATSAAASPPSGAAASSGAFVGRYAALDGRRGGGAGACAGSGASGVLKAGASRGQEGGGGGGLGESPEHEEGDHHRSPPAQALESLLRDRLGHFKLDKDSYNTHFYELHHDHSLAQQNLLQSGTTGAEPKGDILFWIGSSVRAARLAGMLVSGGLSALWSSDGYGGNRLAELRVRADDVTTSEIAALFRKCITHDQSSFTLNRVKEYARETGLRVVEYSYCAPRHKRCVKGDFAVFLELEAVPTLTSHHGVHPGGGGGGGSNRTGPDGGGSGGDGRNRGDTWEDYLEVGV